MLSDELVEQLPDDADAIQMAAELLRDAADKEQPGTLLKAAREYLDWTQVQLGEAMGLKIYEQQGSRQCERLAQWETDAQSPNWNGRSAMLDLADALEEQT